MNEKIAAFVKENEENIINDWRDLVNLEGSRYEPENMYIAGEWLKDRFTEAGVNCELLGVSKDIPPVLVGTMNPNSTEQPVIFSGHFDTVFAKGKFGDHPFRIEEGKAYGPGVLDMKGGVIIALWTIKALKAIGFDKRPIRICFVGDEENAGPEHEHSNQQIYRMTEGCIAGFNMETSPIDYRLCTGRKWISGGTTVFHGLSAHSGNNYEAGRNAIVEAAYKVIAIQNLNDMEKGTHMNPAIIEGGTVANAIPDTCTLKFTGRYKYRSEIQRVTDALKEMFEHPVNPDIRIEYSLIDAAGGFEETDGNLRLCDFVNEVCKKEGFPEVSSIYLGGGSDAAKMAETGVPLLCSCGVRGQWNHTEREYAIVDSIFERVNLWANVVLMIEGWDSGQ